MITPTVATPTIPAAPISGTTAAPAPSHTSTMRRIAARSPAAAADSVWVPMASAFLILVAGAMTLATRSPWLFAALGPSAVVIAASPGHPTTRFHSVVLGHLTAITCGWLAVLLMGAGDAPGLAAGHAATVGRVWASAAAVAATALVQPSLRAWHPPAAATALLVTLGAYGAGWRSFGSLMAGVIVVATIGEWLQRTRLQATGLQPSA